MFNHLWTMCTGTSHLTSTSPRLFTYKMGIKSHPHFTEPLCGAVAAGQQGNSRAGQCSVTEGWFCMMGDHIKEDEEGEQPGLQKPDGKGPYVLYQGARTAMERLTAPQVETSPTELLAICQALFLVLAGDRKVMWFTS